MNPICPFAQILRVHFTFTNFQIESHNIDCLYLKASDIDDLFSEAHTKIKTREWKFMQK